LFTLTEKGTANTITIYVKNADSSSHSMDVGIYSGLSLLSHLTQSISASYDNWKVFDIPDVELNAGVYGLAFKFINTENIYLITYYNTGDTNQTAYDIILETDSLPNPFIITGYNARKYSIYCTYTITEAGTTENFYGTIPLAFTISHIRQSIFEIVGTIPITFTLASIFSYSFSSLLYFYGTIPLTFTLTSAFNYSFTTFLNLYGTIPLGFSVTSQFAYSIVTNLLNLYGTIPLTFSVSLQKLISFNLYSTIPLTFTIQNLINYWTGTMLNLYGTIPLNFLIETYATVIGAAAAYATQGYVWAVIIYALFIGLPILAIIILYKKK
jgi:hypothetical protein